MDIRDDHQELETIRNFLRLVGLDPALAGMEATTLASEVQSVTLTLPTTHAVLELVENWSQGNANVLAFKNAHGFSVTAGYEQGRPSITIFNRANMEIYEQQPYTQGDAIIERLNRFCRDNSWRLNR